VRVSVRIGWGLAPLVENGPTEISESPEGGLTAGQLAELCVRDAKIIAVIVVNGTVASSTTQLQEEDNIAFFALAGGG